MQMETPFWQQATTAPQKSSPTVWKWTVRGVRRQRWQKNRPLWTQTKGPAWWLGHFQKGKVEAWRKGMWHFRSNTWHSCSEANTTTVMCVRRASASAPTPPTTWSTLDRVTFWSSVLMTMVILNRLIPDRYGPDSEMIGTDFSSLCMIRAGHAITFWSSIWMTTVIRNRLVPHRYGPHSEVFGTDLSSSCVIHTRHAVTFWSSVWTTTVIRNRLIPDLNGPHLELFGIDFSSSCLIPIKHSVTFWSSVWTYMVIWNRLIPVLLSPRKEMFSTDFSCPPPAIFIFWLSVCYDQMPGQSSWYVHSEMFSADFCSSYKIHTSEQTDSWSTPFRVQWCSVLISLLPAGCMQDSHILLISPSDCSYWNIMIPGLLALRADKCSVLISSAHMIHSRQSLSSHQSGWSQCPEADWFLTCLVCIQRYPVLTSVLHAWSTLDSHILVSNLNKQSHQEQTWSV